MKSQGASPPIRPGYLAATVLIIALNVVLAILWSKQSPYGWVFLLVSLAYVVQLSRYLFNVSYRERKNESLWTPLGWFET